MNRLTSIFFFLFFSFAIAQEETPALKSQKVGEIPDSNLEQIMESREDLNPTYGFEEIYVALNKKNPTSKTGAVLNLENIDEVKDAKDIYWGVTVSGILKFDRESMSAPGASPKKFPIVASGNTGTTQVLVYNRDTDPQTKKAIPGEKLFKVFRITVTDENMVDLMQQMKAKMGKIEGVELRIIGDQVVVDGKIVIPRDLRRVLTVVQNYQAKQKPVELLAEISPLALQLLADKMQDEINGGKDRPTNIYVRVLNGRFILEGSVDKRIERDIAVQTCQAMIQDQFQLDPKQIKAPNYNLPECMLRIRIRPGAPLDPDPIITVRVDFVSLVRNYIKAFNFQWGPGVSATADFGYTSDVGRLVGNFQAIVSGLFPTLDTLARNGHARILKSATLLVRDGDDNSAGEGGRGTKATIEERLEIPYFTAAPLQANGQPGMGQWDFKPILTKIQLEARSIPGTDKINMSVDATQTEQQDRPAPDAPPGVLSYAVNTQLVVSNGDSAALGGMISERRMVSMGRDPASGSAGTTANSITLFEMARFHEFQDQKNQMIIFVTPQKIRNASEGTESLKRKFRLKK